jgi:Histidine kinase-, DNA gyrase B-, and HSP90-like ATPase
MPVARKTEVGPIDGTPEKRMFWAIISDYDLKTGVCELVDNAIDLWTMAKTTDPLTVAITLDAERQLIVVNDNAGGVKHDELRLLIAPGGSRNDPLAEVIGIFGVGGKRASIALGEQVAIKTRYKKQQSHQIDITKDWLEHGDWEIPAYTIPNIAPGTTAVEISHLRKPFTQQDVEEIRRHLGETYAWFLDQGCTLSINETPVEPKEFDHWAYPKGYPPRDAAFDVKLGDETVKVTITAGLITDREPEQENYGVYIYCNHRLIVKELRTRDVGYFVTAEAGVPHSDASLCRAIVRLQGPAKLMPWNSSKSGINPGHPIFQRLRPTLIQLVTYFSSLSRRLRKEVDEKVTPFTAGTIEQVATANIAPGRRLNLPELPRVNKQPVEHLKARNKKLLKEQPWTVGIVEAMAAVDVMTRQRFDTKNRIALILLDSNFEIALKEFMVHRTDLFPKSTYTDARIAQLFKNRTDVITEVTKHVTIPPTIITRTKHYYDLRNKLIHERATVGITDPDVDNYRTTVQKVLKILFKLSFAP